MSVRRTAAGSAVLLALFTAWTVATATGRAWPLDRTVLGWRLATHSRVVEPVRLLSVLGGSEVTAVVVVLLIVVAVAAQAARRPAAVLALLLVLSGGVEYVLKRLLDHPPPLGIPGGTDPHLVFLATPYSYPSGHTLRVLLVVAALLPLAVARSRWLAVPLLLGMLAVLASRVLLAQHWASDVIGGALLAAGLMPWLVLARRPSPSVVEAA